MLATPSDESPRLVRQESRRREPYRGMAAVGDLKRRATSRSPHATAILSDALADVVERKSKKRVRSVHGGRIGETA